MDGIIPQLHRLRRLSRLLWLAQRCGLGWAVALGVVLAAATADYVVRFSGAVRLAVGVAFLVGVAAWLARVVIGAWSFRPPLSVLALRAERLYPQLRGWLATCVEFTAPGGDGAAASGASATTAALVGASVAGGNERAKGVSLGRLVDPRKVIRASVAAIAVTVVVCVVGWTWPEGSVTALWRWVAPLGTTQWPSRVRMQSVVEQTVWPADVPVLLKAQVVRGYREGMRVWTVYRVVEGSADGGSWRRVLMNLQKGSTEAAGGEEAATASVVGDTVVEDAGLEPVRQFEQVLEPLDPSQAVLDAPRTVEFYFEAGDDRTEVERVLVVPRPEVKSVAVRTEPPAYTGGLARGQEVQLGAGDDRLAAAAALEGSMVHLSVIFNKEIPVPAEGVGALFGGLGSDLSGLEGWPQSGGEGVTKEVGLSFVLDKTVETPIRVTDVHGLTNASDRIYRIQATEDQLPTVSVVTPSHDEQVLAGAVVAVKGIAHDDLALESLWLEAKVTPSSAGGTSKTPGSTFESEVRAIPERAVSAGPSDRRSGNRSGIGERSLQDPMKLARTEGRRSELSLEHELDLALLGLKPGDVVALTAVAEDAFELRGVRHPEVRSQARLLRVIDEATFVGQLRTELTALRRRVSRLEWQQGRALELEADESLTVQRRLTEDVGTQLEHVEGLQSLMNRNRFVDASLDRLLDEARGLLQEAGAEAKAAAQLLDSLAKENSGPKDPPDPRRVEARAHQSAAQGALKELLRWLDQGQDAVAIQTQLQELLSRQEAVAGDTRKLVPQTLGQSLEQLSPQNRAALEELARRQGALAEQAQALVDRMAALAFALSEPGQSLENQALAEALSRAAAKAQQEGLASQMGKSAEQLGGNQLSSAAGPQRQAAEVMRGMLGEFSDLDEQRQAVLHRHLTQLEEAIRRLVEQQQAQLTRLEQISDVTALEPPLAALRRNTLATAEQAQQDEVSGFLDQAGDFQGRAIQSLRQKQIPAAGAAERSALEELNKALAAVVEKKKEQESAQAEDQRRKLRERYEQLAQAQEDLKNKTDAVIQNASGRSRRERAQLMELGDQQAQLGAQADQIKPQVAQSVVFTHLHQRIDALSGQVEVELRGAEPKPTVVEDQSAVAGILRRLAGALADEEKQDSRFTEGQKSGGGGGGGGGAMAGPVIPPVAELKLLRDLQQEVYDSTRSAGGGAHDRDVIQSLSQRQVELAQLGRALLEKARGGNAP